MTSVMTPIMTNEVVANEVVVVNEVVDVDVVVEVVDLSHLSVSNYNPKIECPADMVPRLKPVYIFTQWFSQITPAVSMTDPAVLTHFDEYHTYMNSKKCRAIRKTKETFPFKGVVKEVKEKKKRITKKKDVVLDSEGNEIVAEKKKRNNKKKEEVNVEVPQRGNPSGVGSDGEPEPVPVVEKKKRNNKKKEEVDVDVEVNVDVEVPVVEKKKRITKKEEVNVEVVEVGSDVEEPVVVEKKKRNNKKTEVNVEVGSDVEPVVVEKKKITKKSKAVVETTDTDDDIADALVEINNLIQELEEED